MGKNNKIHKSYKSDNSDVAQDSIFNALEDSKYNSDIYCDLKALDNRMRFVLRHIYQNNLKSIKEWDKIVKKL